MNVKQEILTVVNRTVKKSFKLILIFAGLFIVAAPLVSDELDEARLLEREGRIPEAQDIYRMWLGTVSNRSDERFGRILLHIIRMPGSAEEDLGLLKTHLSSVPVGEDRTSLLEYAIVLSELMGADSLIFREELDHGTGSDEGLLDRLPPDRDITLNDPAHQSAYSRNVEFHKYLAYKNWDKKDLIPWINKVHLIRSELLNHPDWIYQLIRVLEQYGLSAEAEEYRQNLMSRFSNSLEADLLTGRVSLLPAPSDLFNGSADLISEPGEGEPPVSPSPSLEPSSVFIQVGAFGKRENAQKLRDEIGREGLESRIVEDGGIYKLIVISSNESHSSEILNRLGLKGFRIPRIP